MGMDERRLIREGVVTAINEASMTARVTFEDRDALVSSELPILARGSSSAAADYWLPSLEDTAVCIFAPNDDQSGQGWLLGTRYNEKNPPAKAGGRRVQFADGTTIEYVDGALNISVSGALNINVSGDINITADGNINIKGKQIHLND